VFESLLVADHGLGAARVLLTCRRLGIKSVLAGLSTEDAAGTDAAHLADDEVLLADAAELSDPTAVVRAAQAAGVQAIHPGYGPLRASAELARAAAEVGLTAILTTGIGTPEQVAAALGAENVPVMPAGARAARFVYVFGAHGRIVVLGSTRVDVDGLIVAGDDADGGSADSASSDRNTANRLAHAAAAVLGIDGVATISVALDGAAGGVVDVGAGLPESHAGWELVTDLDLVELQLDPTLVTDLDVTTGGVAIGRLDVTRIEDARGLDELAATADVDGGGLRFDAVALVGSAHGALVRATAWAEDETAARAFLARYAERYPVLAQPTAI
jgi:Biotin carboxylase, N-terminal domain